MNLSKETRKELRKKIRELAIEIAGGCECQEGNDKQTYPCGTCFNFGLGQLIDKKTKEYKKHNETPDRINEVWRFLLQLRDTKY